MLHIQVVNYGHLMRQTVLFWYSIDNCERFKIMKCAIIIARGCIKRLKKILLDLFCITLDLNLYIFMFKNLFTSSGIEGLLHKRMKQVFPKHHLHPGSGAFRKILNKIARF